MSITRVYDVLPCGEDDLCSFTMFCTSSTIYLSHHHTYKCSWMDGWMDGLNCCSLFAEIHNPIPLLNKVRPHHRYQKD